jgi:hypothetical protein
MAREIGKKRAEVIMRFIELVEKRKWDEAKKYYNVHIGKSPQREKDAKKYALSHVKSLDCSNF